MKLLLGGILAALSVSASERGPVEFGTIPSLKAEDLHWKTADNAERLEIYNQYLEDGGRRRLAEVSVDQRDNEFWIEKIKFDPSLLDSKTEEVLKAFFENEERMSEESTRIAKESAKTLKKIQQTKERIEAYQASMDPTIKVGDRHIRIELEPEAKRQISEFFSRFSVAILHLNDAEFQALQVIVSCIRQTHNTWKRLNDGRYLPEKAFAKTAVSAQRAFEIYSTQTIAELDELIKMMRAARAEFAWVNGQGMQNMRDALDQMVRHREEMRNAVGSEREKREKDKNWWMGMGIGAWAYCPPCAIAFHVKQSQLMDPSALERKLNELINKSQRHTDLLGKDFLELEGMGQTLAEEAKNLARVVGLTRDNMRTLVGDVYYASLQATHIEAVWTDLKPQLDMWRYVVPNKFCTSLRPMLENYRTYTQDFKFATGVDPGMTCELVEPPAPTTTPTQFPTLYEDSYHACWANCEKKEFDFPEIKQEFEKMMARMRAKMECMGECDVKNMPTLKPTEYESPLCKQMEKASGSVACFGGEPYIMLSHPEDNFSAVFDKVNGDQNTCKPTKVMTYVEGARTDYHGLRIVSYDPASKKVQVDVNDMAQAQHSGNGGAVPYGTAGDCFTGAGGCPKGEFAINLDDTGFRVSEYVSWSAVGGVAGKRAAQVTVSADRTKVMGKCGGGRDGKSCGGCSFDRRPYTSNEGQRLLELTLVEDVQLTALDRDCYEVDVAYDNGVHTDARGKAWRFPGLGSVEACAKVAQDKWQFGEQSKEGEFDCPVKILEFCPIWWTYKGKEDVCELKITRDNPKFVESRKKVASGATQCIPKSMQLGYERDPTEEVKCEEHVDKALRPLECAERRWVADRAADVPVRCDIDFLVGVCTSGAQADCRDERATDPQNRKYMSKVGLCQRTGTGILQKKVAGRLAPMRSEGDIMYAMGKARDMATCNVYEGYGATGFCASGQGMDCKCKKGDENGCQDDQAAYPFFLMCQRGVYYEQPFVKKAYVGRNGDTLVCPHGYVQYSLCASTARPECFYNGNSHWQVIECAKVANPLAATPEEYLIAGITGHYEFVTSSVNPEQTLTESVTTREGTQLENWVQNKFELSTNAKVGLSGTAQVTGAVVTASATSSYEFALGTSSATTRTIRNIVKRSLAKMEGEKITAGCVGSKLEGNKHLWRWVQDTTLANGRAGPTIKTTMFICTGPQAQPYCHPSDCVDDSSCEVCMSDLIETTPTEDEPAARRVAKALGKGRQLALVAGGAFVAAIGVAVWVVQRARKGAGYEPLEHSMA